MTAYDWLCYRSDCVRAFLVILASDASVWQLRERVVRAWMRLELICKTALCKLASPALRCLQGPYRQRQDSRTREERECIEHGSQRHRKNEQVASRQEITGLTIYHAL